MCVCVYLRACVYDVGERREKGGEFGQLSKADDVRHLKEQETSLHRYIQADGWTKDTEYRCPLYS